MMRNSIAATFFLTLLSNNAFTQERAAFKEIGHFYAANGLQQNIVASISQGKDGIMWIVNNMELVRFDGRNTFPVKNQAAGSDEERLIRVAGVYGKGRIFVRTCKKDVFYEPCISDKHLFRRLFKDSIVYGAAPTLPRAMVVTQSFHRQVCNRIIQDLAGTYEGNIQSLFNPESVLVVDSISGYLPFAGRLYYLNSAKGSIRVLNNDVAACTNILAGGYLLLIRPNGDKQLFSSEGEVRSGSRRLLSQMNVIASGQGSHFGLSTYHDADDDFLLINSRLYVFRFNGGEPFFSYVTSLDKATTDFLTSINYDRSQDVLFIGTINAGLYLLARDVFEKFGNEINYSHLRLRNKDIISTYGRFRYDHGQYQYLPFRRNLGFPAFHEEGTGFVYVGVGSFISVYDSTYTKLISSVPAESPFISYTGDRRGNVWYTAGKRLGIFSGSRHMGYVNVSGLPADLKRLSFISEKRMWMATDSAIYRFDILLNRLERIVEGGIGKISFICNSSNGSLWIAAYGAGLFRYDDRRGLVKLPLDRNGSLLNPHGIYEDGKGYFWIPTNSGLIKAQRNELEEYKPGEGDYVYYYRFTDKLLLPTNEFNGGGRPALCGTPDGYLSLPSMEGLVIVNTSAAAAIQPLYPLNVKRVFSDSAILQGNHFTLPYDFKELTVEVECPYYGANENFLIQYKIWGVDKDWRTMNEERVIYINRLPSDNYILEIRKVNGFGHDNFESKKIYITVMFPWYRRPWVYWTIGISGLLIGYFGFRWRLKRLQKAKAELEAQVSERTKTLAAKVSELETSQRALLSSKELNEQLTSTILHDIRSPLMYMAKNSEMLMEMIRSDEETALIIARQINQSSERIVDFSEKFLKWVRSQNENISIVMEEFDIARLCSDVISLYAAVAKTKDIDISYIVTGSQKVISDHSVLSTILRNLLDNAIKATDTGTISISCDTRGGSQLVIRVANKGRQMYQESLIRWNELLKGNIPQKVELSFGLGSLIIARLLKSLNGKGAVIISDIGETIFELTIPILELKQ